LTPHGERLVLTAEKASPTLTLTLLDGFNDFTWAAFAQDLEATTRSWSEFQARVGVRHGERPQAFFSSVACSFSALLGSSVKHTLRHTLDFLCGVEAFKSSTTTPTNSCGVLVKVGPFASSAKLGSAMSLHRRRSTAWIVGRPVDILRVHTTGLPVFVPAHPHAGDIEAVAKVSAFWRGLTEAFAADFSNRSMLA